MQFKSCLQQPTPLCFQIFIVYWRIESYMFLSMNLIRLNILSILFFYQKSFCNIFVLCLLISALYLLNQIFILIIHHYFKSNYLRIWVFSIFNQKVIIKFFFNYIFPLYWSFTRSINFEQFYWITSLLLSAEGYEVLYRFQQFLSIYNFFSSKLFLDSLHLLVWF